MFSSCWYVIGLLPWNWNSPIRLCGSQGCFSLLSLDQSIECLAFALEKCHNSLLLSQEEGVQRFEMALFFSCHVTYWFLSLTWPCLEWTVCVCTFLCVVSVFPCIISFRSGELCHAAFSTGKQFIHPASPVIHFWNIMTGLKYEHCSQVAKKPP